MLRFILVRLLLMKVYNPARHLFQWQLFSSRLVYFSAVEARFWLFITSRRLSRCAEVWRKSVRGLGGSGLGGLSATGGGLPGRSPAWAGAGADWAGFGSGRGMGSTRTLTLGALSLEPAGLPLPRLGSGAGSDGADGAGSDGADGRASWGSGVSEFSRIVASDSAIYRIVGD